MSEVEPTKLRLLAGALVDVPIHEPHKRGANWAAVIEAQPTQPGGLARTWLPRARGECHYMATFLSVGDVIEFAADYTTTHGDKKPRRWYGVVVEITAEHIALRERATATDALLFAREFRR